MNKPLGWRSSSAGQCLCGRDLGEAVEHGTALVVERGGRITGMRPPWRSSAKPRRRRTSICKPLSPPRICSAVQASWCRRGTAPFSGGVSGTVSGSYSP